MTKIVLLNGPGGVGKDAVAAHATTRTPNAAPVKFAGPLKKIAMHVFCDGNSQVFNDIDRDQKKKMEPLDIFFGKSCRQVQIDISEIYLKKAYDESIFGTLLAKEIDKMAAHQNIETFFVSDSGFVPEAEVLAKEYGAHNVTLIRLHRKECPVNEDGTFPNDSRSYINLDHLGVESHDVVNKTGELGATIETILEILNPKKA